MSNGFRIIQRFSLADDFGAGSARKVSGLTTRRCAARGGERSLSLAFAFSWWPVRHAPRRQRAATCARASHQVSARFRPQPGRTHQLSDRSTSLPRTAARTLSFRSDGRKLARPDETGRVPKMAARLRPASSRLRREALPVAEDESNSTARLRPVQGVSIIRETGHFCTASISQATLRRTETAGLTAKTNFDRHPGAGLRGLLVSAEGTDKNQPAIIPLRSSGGESGNLVIALARRCQERVQTPRQIS